MATVPTGRMEKELRKLYRTWVRGIPNHANDLAAYIDSFRAQSERIIATYGGRAASLGAIAGFPAPRELALNPVIGIIYDEMKQVAVSAALATGLNATDVARAMLDAGLDKSYRRLERFSRTEVVRAYWQNTWDSTRELDLILLWSSETGPRTCDICLERDGLVVEDESITDHPNGRCTLLPVRRESVDYKGTLMPDGSTYYDPAWREVTV